jgi:hypothetical protein
MLYALLLYDHARDCLDLADDRRVARARDFRAIAGIDRLYGGVCLHPPDIATTVRLDGQRLVMSDAPAASAELMLGGWLLTEAAHLDAALDTVAQVLAARPGGALEVRPLLTHLGPPSAIGRHPG